MKKTTNHLKLCFCFFAALFLFAMIPAKADAASYQSINVNPYSDSRSKVGSYYFWSEVKNGKTYIYSSKSAKAKKGTLLATVIIQDSSCPIFTNGSTVFYASPNKTFTKHTIYSIKSNGKNRKKHTTVKTSSYGRVAFIKLYNNRIFYQSIGKNPSFCSMSLKNNKTKTHIKNFSAAYTSSGKNVYTITNAKTKSTVRIFDCKKLKVIKTHSIKVPSGSYPYIMNITKKYIYTTVIIPSTVTNQPPTYKFYRCPTNGSGKMELIKTLQCDMTGGINDSYIYYGVCHSSETETTYTYYRYNIKTKKTQEISENTFNKSYQ